MAVKAPRLAGTPGLFPVMSGHRGMVVGVIVYSSRGPHLAGGPFRSGTGPRGPKGAGRLAQIVGLLAREAHDPCPSRRRNARGRIARGKSSSARKAAKRTMPLVVELMATQQPLPLRAAAASTVDCAGPGGVPPGAAPPSAPYTTVFPGGHVMIAATSTASRSDQPWRSSSRSSSITNEDSAGGGGPACVPRRSQSRSRLPRLSGPVRGSSHGRLTSHAGGRQQEFVVGRRNCHARNRAHTDCTVSLPAFLQSSC